MNISEVPRGHPFRQVLQELPRLFREAAVNHVEIAAALSLRAQFDLDESVAWLIAAIELIQAKERLMKNAQLQATYAGLQDVLSIFTIDAIPQDAVTLCIAESK